LAAGEVRRGGALCKDARGCLVPDTASSGHFQLAPQWSHHRPHLIPSMKVMASLGEHI